MHNMFRVLMHPSSEACDLFVELFHGLYCSGTMYVGVTVWFGWCGVVSGCRLKHYSVVLQPACYSVVHATVHACYSVVLQPASGYHTTPAKPHRNTNTHRTRAVQPMK